MPRGGTAPVRRVIVSRWKNGKILEGDFSGLEFRMAGELSGDTQIFDDVLSGKDVHKQTASIIFQKDPSEVTKDERQFAKPYTFAPLYGGAGVQYAPHIRAYFQEFFVIYKGVKEWHDKLKNEAIATGMVTIPSGRQYAFPYARRNKWGGVSGSTRIVNYPCQGHSTADVVPCAFIRMAKILRREGVKSLLINTVHDSIVIDVYPGEEDIVIPLMREAMLGVVEDFEKRYGYKITIPVAMEMKIGDNWLEGKEFK